MSNGQHILPLMHGGGGQAYLPGLAALGADDDIPREGRRLAGLAPAVPAGSRAPDVSTQPPRAARTLNNAESEAILAAASGRAAVEVPWHTVHLSAQSPLVNGDSDSFTDAELRAFNVAEYRPAAGGLLFHVDQESHDSGQQSAFAVRYEPSLFGNPTGILIEAHLYVLFTGNKLKSMVSLEIQRSGSAPRSANAHGGPNQLVVPVKLPPASGPQWLTVRAVGASKPLTFSLRDVYIKAPS